MFKEAKEKLMRLITAEQLADTAVRFLVEGNEIEEAAVLAACVLEYGDVKRRRGTVFECDITLRCDRQVMDKLGQNPSAFEHNEEGSIRVTIKNALNSSLPAGYGVAELEARAKIASKTSPEKAEEDILDIEGNLFTYDFFLDPENISTIGRELMGKIIGPFETELGDRGIRIPSASVEDDQYFKALAEIFGKKEKLPKEMLEVLQVLLNAINELRRDLLKGIGKEIRENHVVFDRYVKETGRDLLQSVVGGKCRLDDYPEKLTPEQAERVGALLDNLTDYRDVSDMYSGSALLEFEQVITKMLKDLSDLGLRVFAGNYNAKIAGAGFDPVCMPVTKITIAEKNDPRIRRDSAGKEFMKTAIRKRGPSKGSEGEAANETGSEAEGGDGAKEEQEQEVGLFDLESNLVIGTDGKLTVLNSASELFRGVLDSREDKSDEQRVSRRGRLGWLPDCSTVWLDGKAIDLRNRKRARACLQYLVDNRAFGEESARDLIDEIDLFVRGQYGEERALHATVRIQDYFKRHAELQRLCKEIVKSGPGKGEYYLKVD
jgi:hypothetical protein